MYKFDTKVLMWHKGMKNNGLALFFLMANRLNAPGKQSLMMHLVLSFYKVGILPFYVR